MAVDPRQNGLAPIRGLNRLQQYQQQPTQEDLEYTMLQRQNKLSKKGGSSVYRPEIGTFTESRHYEPGTPGYEKGLSRYDREEDALTTPTSFEELNQSRYENQSAWDVFANGLIKTAGRTATSFINSMVGAVAGGATAVYNAATGKDDWWTGFWNNPLSNAMADVDDWFNENFTNYQSLSQQQNERNGEWYKNLGSLNMWMDDVLTNTGFTLGMMAASMTGAGLLGTAAKAMKGVGLVDKYGAQAAKAITLLNSTAGEAATEALGAQREHIQSETQRINDSIDSQIAADPNVQQLDMNYQQQLSALDTAFGYNRNDPNYKQYRQQIEQQYQQQRSYLTSQYEQHRSAAMEQMQDEANSLGLAVGLGNMAILGISNFNLAGRFVDKAYNNAVKSAGNSIFARNSNIGFKNAFGQHNVTGNAATGYGSRSAVGNISKRIASNVLSEGVYEEMGQGALTAGAKSYYAYEDVDNYWRARLDPDSVDMTADGSHDFLKAVGNGLNETYGSAEGWKEGFIGGITGALFGAGETRQEWKNTRHAKRAAKDLNNALANPKMQTLLQHLVAQGFHAQNKERLAEEGNQSDWKTEDDKALFSIISAFARAGKMDDLHEMLRQESERMDSMSDDDLNKLISDSTKVTTAEQQKAALRQGIDNKLNAAIESLLKDGATAGDLNQAQAAVQQAKQAEQQALQEAQRAEQGVQAASRLRNVDRVAMNRLRERSRNASQKAQEAARARKAAEDNVALMFKEGRGLNDVNRLLAERDQHMQDIDSQDYTDIYDGPFVDADGNRMTAKDVHERLKHNVESLQQSVQHYQDAIEEVNRRTRGMFSKDEEDYLAYNFFLDKTHVDHGDNLLKPWRGVLPERVPLQIPKGKAKRLAKALGISEGAIQEDPDKEGQVWVSTKDMTDEQYADFMMNGFLGQTHLTRVNGNGQVMREATEQYRKQMRDEALKAIEDEMKRSGKVKSFDREKFQRDIEDAAKAYAKAHNYQRARAEMMQNPEKLMTSKQKFLRNLKRSWDKKKAKLMQKKMSIQQLGDLTNEQMKELDDYHFALAKVEKIRRQLAEYYDSMMPGIQDKIEDAFDFIKDQAVRDEVIRRVKQRVNDILMRFKEYSENDGPIDVESEEISEMLNLNKMFDSNDEFWKNLDPKTRDAIRGALNQLSGVLKSLLKSGTTVTKRLRKFFDKLRTTVSTSDDITGSDSQSLLNKAATLLGKAFLSDSDIKDLNDLKKAIQEKIAELSSEKGFKNTAIIKALNAVLKKINDYITKNDKANSPDSGPGNSTSGTYGQPEAKDGAKRSDTGSASAQQQPADDVERNPSQEEEEAAVNTAADESLHIRITERGSIPGNPWQTVTGEFARRSGFTYQTYHELVQRKLDKWDEEHPDPTEEDLNKDLPIDELKPYGHIHTVKEWKRLAKRSKVVHDRLTAEQSFGTIDSGEVQATDDLRFLVTRDPDVGIIVYLVHEKDGKQTIIGDLTEPDRNLDSNTDPDLLKLWTELEKELDESGETEKLSDKFKSHVGNVYSGFLKYRGTDAAGRRQYSPVGSLDGSDDVAFHICGTNPQFDDIFGSGKRGQPVVIVKRPGNDGMTRRVAVPVVTMPFNDEGVEAKVIAQAAKVLNEEEFTKFLKHFLHCSSVFVSSQVVEDADTGKTVTMYTVDVHTRNTAVKGSETTAAGERIKERFTVTTDGSISIKDGSILRANVSRMMMQPGNTMYQRVVESDSSLPQDYTSFLKQVCQTAVEDFHIHNSWITVNPISIADDGTVTETDITEFTEKKTINVKGNVEITLNDPVNNLVYIVEFDSKSESPNVLSIRGGSAQSKLPQLTVTGANKAELLHKMAIAASRFLGSSEYDATNSFTFQGIKYEYYLETGGEVSDIAIAETQRVQSKATLDAMTLSELAYIARHYNGKNLADIINAFFHVDRFQNNPNMQRALETLLKEMKDGKTSFSTGFTVQSAIVNSHKPITERQQAVATALAKHLSSKGVTVIIDNAAGQARLERANEILKNDGPDALDDAGNDDGVSYLLDNSGTIVYGFADHSASTPTIYLDKDLLNPETVIHEYTHLWVRCLRHGSPEVWNGLVDDLEKRFPTVWQSVVRAYGKRVRNKDNSINRDKVADEVFAKITGEEYAKRFLNDIGLSKQAEGTLLKNLRSLYNKFINAVRAIFNKPLAETLSELVVEDMLSDNPLTNFDLIDKVGEHFGLNKQTGEGAATEDKKEESGKTTISTEDGYSVQQLAAAKRKFDNNKVKYRFDPRTMTFTFDSAKERAAAVALFDDSVSSQISITEPKPLMTAKAQEAFDKLGEQVLRNLKRLHTRDPRFQGMARRLTPMRYGIDHGFLRSNDFILAAEVLLSDEERMRLWELAAAQTNTVTDNVDMCAEINHMFNRRLQGESLENEELNRIMDALRQRIDSIIKNEGVLSRTESSITDIASSLRVSAPSDPISNLTEEERSLARRDLLSKLSDKDRATLSEAGFSADLYKSSPDSIKEWMHRCVL